MSATGTSSVHSTEGSAAPVIEDGQWVLLLFSGGERRMLRARRSAKMSAGGGKQQVLMDPLIGAPFGANFRIEPGGLMRDSRTVEQINGSVSDAVCAQPDATNAELFDEGSSSKAQKLGEADIRRLKEGGAHGADLVKAIAANSATFAGKTAFAQDKYLRKKAKKHMPFLTVVRPTPLSIVDMYMNKAPDKVLSLRRDTLALLLATSNVQPGSRALVVESLNGVLVGGVTAKLGGEGRVVAGVFGGKANLDGVQWLNLPDAQLATVHSCQLADLLACLPRTATGGDSSGSSREGDASCTTAATTAGDAASAGSTAVEGTMAIEEAELTAGDADSGGNGGGEGEGVAAAAVAAKAARKISILRGDDLAAVVAEKFTSLLVAVRENPAVAIVDLLATLVPGSPFAIYHPCMPPLAECMHACQHARAAVRVQLVESWARPYQVAENRTHPTMNAYPPTGYVLTGVSVAPP